MKEKIISEIIREMLSSLNNEQLSKLKTTLEIYLYNVSIEAKQEVDTEKEEHRVSGHLSSLRASSASPHRLQDLKHLPDCIATIPYKKAAGFS